VRDARGSGARRLHARSRRSRTSSRRPVRRTRCTAAEKQGPYPLKGSPTTFSDGFQPGRYYEWQTIQLHPSTDAVCGNGTPYKFFVNRVPNTRNTLIYLEGGGACWDEASCRGRTGIRGGAQSDGIPTTISRPRIPRRAS
jgi:hypothetical protein